MHPNRSNAWFENITRFFVYLRGRGWPHVFLVYKGKVMLVGMPSPHVALNCFGHNDNLKPL